MYYVQHTQTTQRRTPPRGRPTCTYAFSYLPYQVRRQKSHLAVPFVAPVLPIAISTTSRPIILRRYPQGTGYPRLGVRYRIAVRGKAPGVPGPFTLPPGAGGGWRHACREASPKRPAPSPLSVTNKAGHEPEPIHITCRRFELRVPPPANQDRNGRQNEKQRNGKHPPGSARRRSGCPFFHPLILGQRMVDAICWSCY